jgi:hypothetical protein
MRVIFVVPKLHFGTRLRAQLHCAGGGRWKRSKRRGGGGRRNREDKCVPQWSCGTRELENRKFSVSNSRFSIKAPSLPAISIRARRVVRPRAHRESRIEDPNSKHGFIKEETKSENREAQAPQTHEGSSPQEAFAIQALERKMRR